MGLLELIYYIGYRAHRAYSSAGRRELPSKVISIGNITVGGTGKTPAVIALAGAALRRGLNPCVLTRGYKGKMKGPCFVSVGEGPLLSPEFGGDEPVLMAGKLKGVPIVKSADRYKGGLFAIDELKPNEPFLFILDDGFQHWRLKRDLDVLLIDSRHPLAGEKLLPVGVLREPLKEIKRAGIIVLTKSVEGGLSTLPLVDEIRKYNKHAPVFLSSHKLLGVRGPSGETVPADGLAGRGVYAFCGIGDPYSFKTTLEKAGLNIKGFRAFRDHYAFKVADLKRIEAEASASGAEWIITTEKDIIRLDGFAPQFYGSGGLYAAVMEMSVADDFYDEVFRRI